MAPEAVADIGLIGLAVMGQNLILNMNDKGYTVCAYNRTTSKVDDFLNNEAKGTNVVGAHSVEEFVAKLKRPRKMIILVKAGPAVDAFIDTLVPHLEQGDIIIDGGNSHYPDSIRRCEALEKKGLLFVGSGVSGGEEGARHGPSLMPGGSDAAWPHIKEIFQRLPLNLTVNHAVTGSKGYGKWTAINALDLGQPVTLIGEAVFARCLSSLKEERTRASKKINGPSIKPFEGNKQQFIADLEQALYASKIVSYAQGFMLMREAAKEYNWTLNNPSIALMWRGGCIIRSVFLKDITNAFRKNPELENLLFDDFFNKAIHDAQEGWRRVVAQAILWGVPTPAHSTALAFFDGYRTERLPANILQAQRDLFGAHTFKVLPGKENDLLKAGADIHINWTGRGGNVSASTYTA
ncbi:hypothetical protein L7F22_019367 [Adiantum nelumboides]|nr:hypothetical protein [Adiantum nelumboides]